MYKSGASLLVLCTYTRMYNNKDKLTSDELTSDFNNFKK